MFNLAASVSIYICDKPVAGRPKVALRCGFDGLAAIVQNTLGMNPPSGGLFLFLGRRRDRIKILFWDRDGYALYSKRLERGRFPFPVPLKSNDGSPAYSNAAYEMTLMLEGICLAGSKRSKRFKLGA